MNGRRLGIGLNLPYTEGQMDGATPRWADVLTMAQAAEEVGFDAVWVSDHVGFGEPDGAWAGAWESWTLLAALAASTRRVRLGTYVTCTPFRNPALLAKMAETLDEVSGGRVILGLGAGWNEPEFEAYGFSFKDRFDRFEDSLRIICSMVRTGESSHEGRVVRTRRARLAPRGPRPGGLEVMCGATGPRLLRLTAELADHWNGGMRSAAETVPLLATLDAACVATGRDPASITRSVEALVRTLPSPDSAAPEDREIRGTPAEIAAALLDYAALGIDHLQVQLRPNRLEAVVAFGAVIEALGRTSASSGSSGSAAGSDS